MLFKRTSKLYIKRKKKSVSKSSSTKKSSPRASYSLVEPFAEMFDNVLTWIVPIRLKTPNVMCSPFAQCTINRDIAKTLLKHMPKEMDLVNLPVHITFVRMGPRTLDYDNLVYSFKKIRDFMSGYLKPGLAAGRADADERFYFAYDQESAGKQTYGVKLIFKNL